MTHEEIAAVKEAAMLHRIKAENAAQEAAKLHRIEEENAVQEVLQILCSKDLTVAEAQVVLNTALSCLKSNIRRSRVTTFLRK